MTLTGAVFIVLLILKLAGIGVVATWSWWWVTLPLWGGIAVGLLLYFIAAICGFLSAVCYGIVKAFK